MEDYDGLVGIYSNKNSLTLALEEKYRQKYLDVLIFDDFNKVDTSKFSYLVINLLDLKRDLTVLVPVLRNISCKVLVVHPLFVKNSEKYLAESDLKELIIINNNLGVILVPDILGKNVEFNENAISHKLIMQRVLSERVRINENNFFINTITVSKLSDRIIKDTFSFGISGQILSLIGPRKSKRSFVLKYLNTEVQNIVHTRDDDNIAEIHYNTSVRVDFSLNLAVKNTLSNFRNKTELVVAESLVPEEVIIEEKKNDSRRVKFNFKVLYGFGLTVLFLLLTPLVLILTSALLVYGSYKFSFKDNNFARQLVVGGQSVSGLAKNISFGNTFIYDNANIVYEVSALGLEGILLSQDAKDFVLNIMSDKNYDLEFYSNKISASLEKIHTQISFLQSDVNDLGGVTGDLLKNVLSTKNIDIGKYKENIYDTKLLFSRISTLLGKDSPKKYLILFQNNMELRPTGGFIGSFGLLTFDKGRLTEINVNDVYTADGQLKGHVDPPEPIREHLGEGGWYLRDSNWDPDFPISAIKAEWFLDKELSEKVDGVIAIDLYFIKKILAVTGPVSLVDFEKNVDKDNLYTLIQNEVEEEFFPGSIKKATILTSLSKTLIEEIKSLDSAKYINLFKEVYDSLNQKHILVYLHDENAQAAISSIGYSGEFNLNTECGLRCVRGSHALIDANLGVNKSNYYIRRSHQLNLNVSKNSINHDLLVTYENLANPAIGNSGIYKNYARILLPTNAVFSGVRLYESDGSYRDLEYDLVDMDTKKEVGFLVEVLPSSSKRVQIAWILNNNQLEQGGEYNLNILKQPGTSGDKLDINVSSTDLSLTGRKVTKYNTILDEDFSQRIFFRNNEN